MERDSTMDKLLQPPVVLLASFAFALNGLAAVTTYVVPPGTAGNAPTSPYDSWATAANSIADALAALPSDTDPATIRVAPGIYAVAEQMIPSRQNVEIRSDDGSGHLARETTILDGGFRNAADCDSTNRFFQISKNNFALRGFTLRNSCAAYEKQFGGGAVYISSGIKGVTLDSCTFTNCNAFFVVPKNNVQSNSGGAVSVHYDSANCGHLVTNCLFVDCRSPTGAAAINSGKSRSSWTSRETLFVISDCVFRRTDIGKDATDTTAYGTSQYTGAVSGPVWIENSRFTAVGKGATRATVLAGDYSVLTGCVFENLSNTLFNSSCIISNSVFRNNKAKMVYQSRDIRICSSVITNNGAVGNNPYQNAMFVGGKVVNCLYAYNDHPVTATYGTVFENCTIVSNRNNGVAMTISTGGYSTLRNCLSYGNRYTAWGNSNTRGATSNGNFFYFKDWAGNSADYLTMGNCYFENGENVTLNQYRGNGASTSLLSLDPGERSAAITAAADAAKDKLFADWTHGNWRLQRKSPLREAGQPLDWMERNSTDLDGNPRLTNLFGKPFAAGALPDLGCYECQDITPYCTLVMVQ